MLASGGEKYNEMDIRTQKLTTYLETMFDDFYDLTISTLDTSWESSGFDSR